MAACGSWWPDRLCRVNEGQGRTRAADQDRPGSAITREACRAIVLQGCSDSAAKHMLWGEGVFTATARNINVHKIQH
jgi:hypothetical protein